MQLGEKAECFKAQSGPACILYPEGSYGHYYFSPDGEKFYELFHMGFGGTDVEHHVSFEDPYQQKKREWERRGDTIVFEGVIFEKKIPRFASVEVVPLPEVRKPEYLFLLLDGRFIYVSADKYHFTDESFKLFFGERNKMDQIPIDKVVRYRDGGTTYIYTPIGTFYTPPPFKTEIPSTWGDKKLIKLNPNDFAITEEAGIARLSNA